MAREGEVPINVYTDLRSKIVKKKKKNSGLKWNNDNLIKELKNYIIYGPKFWQFFYFFRKQNNWVFLKYHSYLITKIKTFKQIITW